MPARPCSNSPAPAPTTKISKPSALKPDLELPERFNKLVFTAHDLTDRTPEAAAFAATAFKSVTTGFYRPPSLGHPNLFYGIDGGAPLHQRQQPGLDDFHFSRR